MITFLKKIYGFMLGLPERLVPGPWKKYLDPERHTIDQFMWKKVVPALKSNDLLLDAGAGFGDTKRSSQEHAMRVVTSNKCLTKKQNKPSPLSATFRIFQRKIIDTMSS